jgi:hypothetical protein
MDNLSVNRQFKEYQKNGGTQTFKEFVDKHNRKKNAMGDASVNDMFKHAMGDAMIGEMPIQPEGHIVHYYKNEVGGTSTGTPKVNTDNMTFGINNYVIIGTVVIIVGAIGLNYYLKHKK